MKVEQLVVTALVLAVIGSAVAVVYVKHHSRQLFVETQELIKTRDELNVEWGMLQLERGAWATHGRIERLARERLQMRIPGRNDVVIIEE
ncbi:cell division protein FtsL [Alkalilimnicola ehrlichii]|uniref:Cell division protein FtsL n=1 Tax=Alkalilimnicola ehrlichii TaxID=351052 RepID=A0A3E0WY09_9GAMM|nr:cell division protein FtsL [Alkalilimnicola ehrlichii]RFA30318.1 cell division protein FtsL [Alkalilimnicola ehrlichii]RFA37894.1 cell division protein FtsL [Alkalilimnicola ehrlichii]